MILFIINTKYLKNKYIINLLIILSFIILSFISVALLFKSKIVYVGFDLQFHLRRIEELKESIIQFNNMLPKFSFNEFHGSGVMTLYPYINLLPYVMLSFFTKSKIDLVYIIFIFNSFITFMISFYFSKNYIKSYVTSYIFAIVYGLLNVFIYYNLMGSDLGIVSTYMFLPLIIFGFLKVIQGENNWIQLSIGMSLLLYSHIPNLLIIAAFLLLYLLINLRKINKVIINRLIKSLILFLFLTSIIWMPFLHLYLNNINNINMPIIRQLNRISIKDFMSGLYGSKTNKSIGTFPIIAIFIAPFFYKKFNIYIRQLYVLSLIIVFGTILLPWKLITTHGIFQMLNQFQFTSRFLIIPQMTLSFIFALIISIYIKSYKKRLIASLLIISISILMQVFIGQYVTTIKSLSNNPSVNDYLKRQNGRDINMTNAFGYKINNSLEFYSLINNYNDQDNDYIPKSALSMSSHVNDNIGFYNNNYHQIKINHVGYNTFVFFNKNNINKLSLPIYSYNKEKLHVYLNGKSMNNYTNQNGLLTINNIKSNIRVKNNIYIKESFDSFRIIGAILSIFGWLFTLGVVIKRKFVH